MDSLSAFLPIDRLRALSAGGNLPDRNLGAALFADISGFTPLTATLKHELGSRRGAEELIRNLNNVFIPLIESLNRYHGSVIGFSGDAVTCWFDDSDTAETPDASNAATRAVAAAFDLQAVMTRLKTLITPAGTTIPMGIKVAVAAGPARRFLVGDPQTYVMEVLAGATIDRMSAAEKLAKRGQVIVSAEVLAHISPPPVIARRLDEGELHFALLDQLAEPVPHPPPAVIPVVDDETARPWLLPPVYEQLRHGGEVFQAELRPAIPLFVKFSGIDYDGDDDAGGKLDTFVRHAQFVLDRYEGYLLQITIGDKGSYLYAAFGAPVAHENDIERAASAALDLRDLSASLDFLDPLQIGISRGLTHSGAYGGSHRRTYAVMGSEVNFSARLMTAARPGQILVSPRVADFLSVGFTLNSLPPMRMKGIDQPMAIFELAARKKSTRDARLYRQSVTLFGREMERARIDEALAALTAGHSSVMLIEGAAGIGKSVLLADLLQRAQATEQPLLTLAGCGDLIERSTPYFAWRPIFERLLSDLPASEEERSGASWRESMSLTISRHLPPEVQALKPLLNSVLPLDLPANELTEQMSGELRQINTQRLLIELLRATTGGAPIVLILDDAQWLDSATWSLVDRVRREINPLLLTISTRTMSDDVPPIYAELRDLTPTRHIRLDMLPRAAVEELTSRRLGVDRLPPQVAHLIHEKAEGHPFFSEELAYALRDAGLLHIEAGVARLAANADLEALDFPDTIQGVITSRIDLLTPQQQLTIKVASVIGRIFAFRILEDIYPVELDEELLREYLRRLEKLDITPIETPEPNLAHIFKHLVTQEVAYGLMTSDQRRQLHRSAATWLEKAGEADPYRSLSLLAFHWEMAGETRQAADYYEKAGVNAFRDYANQEAIRFLEQAEALDGENDPAPRRAFRHRLLGEANYRLTHLDRSINEYQTALTLVNRGVPGSAVGRGLGLGRELLRQVGYRLFPKRMVGRARPDEREILLETSRVLEGVAEIHYNLGDFLSTFYCTMTSFNLAEKAGPSPELMRGYANMCATLGTVSLNSTADGYRERALALEASIDDLPARAWSRIPLSSHSLWVGNWDRAEQEIGEALDIYTQLGDWRRWCVAAWIWPQVAQARGELERARDLWAELFAVSLRSLDTRHQVRGRGGQFFNHLSLHDLPAAYECLEAARGVLDENPEMMPVEERLWHAINAVWALRQGEWGRAKAAAEETLAAIGRARFKFDLLEVFSTPAEVLLALWERDEVTAAEAEAGYQALAGYARTYAFARPRALRLRGQFAWRAADHDRARKFWRQSDAQAIALGMPHEQALTAMIAE